MLKGFKEQTEPLTDYERKTLVPILVQGLQTKVGKQSAVTNKYIVSKLKDRYKITEARVRKIINYIRITGLVPCLIATSDGYYIAQSNDEIRDYESSLYGRENAIREVRLSLDRQRVEEFQDLKLDF